MSHRIIRLADKDGRACLDTESRANFLLAPRREECLVLSAGTTPTELIKSEKRAQAVIRNVHRNEFRASERDSTPPLTRRRQDRLLRTEGSSRPLRKEQSWTPKEYNFHMAKEVITFINCFFESLQFAKQFRSENGFLQREACGIHSKCKHIRTPLLASPHTHLQSLSRFALSQSKGQAFFQLLFWGPRALGVACIGLIKAGRMPLPCTASYISGNMVSCQIQEVRLGRNRVFQTYFYKQNSQRTSLRRTRRRTRSCHYLRGRR